MHLIMYSSDYTGSLRSMPKDFSDILTTARSRNPAHQITGVLFYDQGKFIQILEGEKQSIHKLLSKIEQDARHTNVTVLMDEPITKRELLTWNMEAFDLSGNEGKDWSLLQEFRDAYLKNYKVSTTMIIKWLRHFIQDHDKIKPMRR